MSNFFHYTTVMLEPGSRMSPGNWGRIIRTYDVRANMMMLASELLIEQVRERSYAHLPSRMNCNFVFDDEAIARTQRLAFPPHFRLYEVRLVNPEAAYHRAAFNLLSNRTPEPGVPFISHMETLAERYWRGENIQVPEILTTSPLEFVRCLD